VTKRKSFLATFSSDLSKLFRDCVQFHEDPARTSSSSLLIAYDSDDDDTSPVSVVHTGSYVPSRESLLKGKNQYN
jgi:hypothetical protein